MEFFGFKIATILAAFLGAILRITRVESTATTFWGKVLDKTIVFALSMFLALVLLEPVMTFFALAVSYQAPVAMILALSAEIIASKIVDMVRKFDLTRWVKSRLSVK